MVKNRRLPSGDVTVDDQRRFRQIEFLYKGFEKARGGMEAKVQAKCLIAIAYEYLLLGMDEVTDELMLEVSGVCPAYFDGQMKKDMSENEDFDKICRDMSKWYEDRFKI